MQNAIKTLNEYMRRARDGRDRPLYDEREIRAIIDLLLADVAGLGRMDRILHPDLMLPDSQREELLRIATLLEQGVPVQQALGYEWFCGQRFKVTPDVLIPRPETAELVHWIADESSALSPAPSILDIGTGSGCIALSLARLINNSQVIAIDLSTAALQVAQYNAHQLEVDNIQFQCADILQLADSNQQLSSVYPQLFDIIVSNPPYICQQEAAEMSDLVLRHEPDMALFVPDQDPLLFYRAIAHFALQHLAAGGRLFFEINSAYGQQTCQMLRDLGFTAVSLRQDVTGRDRMIMAHP